VIKLSEFLLCENLFSKIPAQLSELFRGVKYPWEVLSGLRDYIKNYLPKSGLVEIFPDVFAAPNVKIASGAEIAGPTVILSGAEIRHGAYIDLRGAGKIAERLTEGASGANVGKYHSVAVFIVSEGVDGTRKDKSESGQTVAEMTDEAAALERFFLSVKKQESSIESLILKPVE